MTNSLIACHECDLLHKIQPLPEGGAARCVRCDALLYYQKKDSLDRTLALTIAGLVLFIVANTFPFLAMKSGSIVRETTLITGVKGLYQQGMESLALLVFLTSILVPFVQIAGMLYVLVPLKFKRVPRNLALVYRFIRSLQPWGMMEVFMLGILVSYVKLGKMAKIIPGLAIYSFVVLIFVLAGAAASLDPRIVWNRLGESW
ncbi:MAG: paraquat-inducible protein A [Deltaproteobacteria bacterium]|nr:MAG: paraquat-inducible protein A [Deltaproteobacteria bacterium]